MEDAKGAPSPAIVTRPRRTVVLFKMKYFLRSTATGESSSLWGMTSAM